MSGRIWSCKIGEVASTPRGADLPMREAVSAAYLALTGEEPVFLFSGWGAELTEPERAVVENRVPSNEWFAAQEAAAASVSAGAGQNVYVKGPTTFTTACTCESQLPGYHKWGCGVFAAEPEAPDEPCTSDCRECSDAGRCLGVEPGPSACPNGPDTETGDWPCDRGHDDVCTVCGWKPPTAEPEESVCDCDRLGRSADDECIYNPCPCSDVPGGQRVAKAIRPCGNCGADVVHTTPSRGLPCAYCGAPLATEEQLPCLCGSSSVSVGAGQVPADTIEKARSEIARKAEEESRLFHVCEDEENYAEAEEHDHRAQAFREALEYVDAALAAVRAPKDDEA